MKNLKKHPKQQRMEDMKIPGYFYIPNGSSKGSKLTLAGLEKEEKAIKKAVKNITGVEEFLGSAPVKTFYSTTTTSPKGSLVNMKIPGSVGKKTEEMRRWDKALEESRRDLEDNRCKSCGVYPGSSHTDRCETLLEIRKRAWKEYKKNDKVTWEGREYLRSINCEHHYWHLLAGLILIGSIVASAYILSHGLVCAPASLGGKTVINCVRK